VTIHAFSWWDVCDGCEKILSNHETLFPDPTIPLSYEIASRRRYQHDYPASSIIKTHAIPSTTDQKGWNAIWGSIKRYTKKTFQSDDEEELFWTTSKEGLEICKWLGQAFKETTIGLDGRAKKGKMSDILTFYKSMQPEETQALEKLLTYLKDKNWDLSCWYRGPQFPNGVQPKWKRHWKQLIMPHFAWEIVDDYPVDDDNSRCDMCGNKNLETIYLVFHPKFHVSGKFLNFSKEEKELTESALGYTHDTPFANLPSPLQNKRKQSLGVGSECVQVLQSSKEEIEEYFERKGGQKIEAKTQEQAERLAANDLLDAEERKIRNSKKKKR